MSERGIECYFCGRVSLEKDAPYMAAPDVIVECPECGRYSLTYRVISFYLKREDVLSQEQKNELSKHVKESYDPERKVAVLIDTDELKKVIRKKAIVKS